MLLNYGFNTAWLFAVLLTPIHPLIRSQKPSMLLKCIGIGLFLQLLGDVLLDEVIVKSVLDSGVVTLKYISCKTLPHIMHLILEITMAGIGNLFRLLFSVLEEQ